MIGGLKVDRGSFRVVRAWILAIAGWTIPGRVAGADETAAAFDPRAEIVQGRVATIVARKELDGATLGIEARSITRGTVLLRRDSARALIPASNLKLLTLALSLELLGEDFCFKTPMLISGPIDEHGTVCGDLWVIGGGDPTLQPMFFESEDEESALNPFVRALEDRNIRRVEGDLVVDDRRFDSQWVHPTWPADQLGLDYCAPVSALSLNANCLSVWVSGERSARLAPEVDGFRALVQLKPGATPQECVVSVLQPDPAGEVVVRGTIGTDVGATRLRVPVIDATLFFGRALRSKLARAGVTLAGGVRRPLDGEAPSKHAREVFCRRSPVRPALYLCGKESDNLIAEHLFKTCAVESGLPGSFEAAGSAALEFIAECGGDPADNCIADGSGLSRENRISAANLVSVLEHMYQGPARDPYMRSLSICGVDGTLEKRMGDDFMRSRVRAKSGYLRAVSGLSGYVMGGSRQEPEVIAFSILINDFKGANSGMKDVQNEICRVLAGLHP